MDIREIVENTLVAPARHMQAEHRIGLLESQAIVRDSEILRLKAINAELLSCLAAIHHSYVNTYDADQTDDGYWKGAASIPVDVMEHAERLIKKHQAVDESRNVATESVAKMDSCDVTKYSDGRCRHQWIGTDHMMWECALCSETRTHD
jgi:hypothetical protein